MSTSATFLSSGGPNGGAVAATTKTMLSFASDGTVIVSITELFFGVTGLYSATDAPVIIEAQKLTADGTGTTITPVDTHGWAARTAGATVKADHSAEPTYTGLQIPLAFNQRNSLKHVGQPGEEFICNRASGEGWGFGVRSPNYSNDAALTTKHIEA